MEKTYDTDACMKQICMHLLRDFRPYVGEKYYMGCMGALGNPDASYIREELGCSLFMQEPVFAFKRKYQMANLLRRYRFRIDAFTDDELRVSSELKFEDTQVRVAQPLVIDTYVYNVLQRARRLISHILGAYDEGEHWSACRFGRKACYGHPLSRSYLDLKCGGPITGSIEHIEWFKRLLPSDKILTDAFIEGSPTGELTYEVCDTLRVSFVPKSFKALRSVKPATLLGGFYTLGLGAVLTERLKREGLDIRRLQELHKRWAQESSVTRKLVTADLSAASDSITAELLRRLLPSAWYRAVMRGVVYNYQFSGSEQVKRLSSVATMGDGHTFPLQTLVFYVLIKAIGELAGARGRYSVYGDDLLYPRRIHTRVAEVLPRLHFKLNMDKTYATYLFRESCGGDYYRGVDVRPFSPEAEYVLLSRSKYAEFLYKSRNGLTRRWDPAEIAETLVWIDSELEKVHGLLLQVPPSYPDGAGVKVEKPLKDPKYAPVGYSRTTQCFVFDYLRRMPDTRVVISQTPYYWEFLRQKESPTALFVYGATPSASTTLLKWERARKEPKFIRSKRPYMVWKKVGWVKTRPARLVPCTDKLGAEKLMVQTGSDSVWI